MTRISVVIPVYKCSHSIVALTTRLKEAISCLTHDFEIIYINDASPENDWEIIVFLAKKDARIKGVNLSRNFGQHYAITAGLATSLGDWVVVMDGDLQDRPEEIVHLYNKAQQGFDIVFAQRIARKDKFLKRLSSAVFYQVLGYLTDTPQNASVANFGIYSRNAVNAVLSMHDDVRFLPTMLHWVGFNKTMLPVQHEKRTQGKSSYSLKKLLQLAFDNLIAFSNKPLRLVVKFGFFIVLLSVLFAMYFLFKYLNGEVSVLGYSSVIISIWFLAGIIIMTLGIVGIYIGKIYEKLKGRPCYIVKNKINI
ncbi:MAG: glycosyltransferase family 2 protein [Candidatus Electrothrix sp. GW3-4]|uniref:glycosyltransferase family 2 protein n=1 Tax=Candidatus Electrothrix sp. GW3-4 TaxID=3126740 RepID=UPI0030D50A5A